MEFLPAVIEAEYRGDYLIKLTFNDGVAETIDFSQWLDGPVFEQLKDIGYFQRFFLDGGTVFRSISMSRRGWIRYENGIPVEAMPPDREHANLITFLYVLLAAALVGGMLATRHSGML